MKDPETWRLFRIILVGSVGPQGSLREVGRRVKDTGDRTVNAESRRVDDAALLALRTERGATGQGVQRLGSWEVWKLTSPEPLQGNSPADTPIVAP